MMGVISALTLIFVVIWLVWNAASQAPFPPQRRSLREQDWWTFYNAYLNSPEWRDSRRRCLARSQGKCEMCGRPLPVNRGRCRFELHHLTYARFGHELPEDLLVVDEACHARFDGTRLIA